MLVVDQSKYPTPRELPDCYLDNDGIYIIDYGKIYVTDAHVVHAIAQRINTHKNIKLPIIHKFEAGSLVNDQSKSVTLFKENIETTLAAAIVTQSIMGEVVSEEYVKKINTPYPVKIFDTIDGAKKWLSQFIQPTL